jgi:hypothetical protein
MAFGLNVSDVVRVSVTINPIAAQYRSFGTPVIIGSSSVVDQNERLRYFTTLDQVASEFGTTAPEYYAAALHFGQSPQPADLYIGRWVQNAAAGLIHGAVLSTSQQLVTNFTSVTAGALSISIDGTARNITGINLSTALNLNGVAQLIQAAIAAVVPGVKVIWGGTSKRFTIVSPTTGTASSVGYSTTAPSGTDLGPLMHLTAVDASTPVVGAAAETLVSCVAALADKSSGWYAAYVATAVMPAASDHIAVANLVEGLSQAHLYGITWQNSNVLDPTTSADLASTLKTLGLKRTWIQYSSTNPYAVASFFGRAATVDFEGTNTTITLMFKQEPGVIAEYLTESQALTLKQKNCNVFAAYNNGTSILQYGIMTGGAYFDEVHGSDWLQNEIQTDCYNLQVTRTTKIPQTDGGMALIKSVIQAACGRGVQNGLIAPGVWTGPAVGNVNTGDTLPSGFYIFAPPVATQTDADRYARISVPFQVLCKLAGAVHIISISVLLNR